MNALSFRAFGFPVVVQPWFWLTVAIMFLFQLSAGGPLVLAFVWGAVIFVSVLVHELGHAMMARSLRVQVGTIELHGLGGHVDHARTTPGRQLAISLAGPGAGLLLGALTLGVTAAVAPVVDLGVYGSAVVEYLLLANVFWSMFNLLPLFPLDGGNALRSGLNLFMREVEAWRITSGIGLLVGVGLAFVMFQAGETFIVWLAAAAVLRNWQILQSLPAR